MPIIATEMATIAHFSEPLFRPMTRKSIDPAALKHKPNTGTSVLPLRLDVLMMTDQSNADIKPLKAPIVPRVYPASLADMANLRIMMVGSHDTAAKCTNVVSIKPK